MSNYPNLVKKLYTYTFSPQRILLTTYFFPWLLQKKLNPNGNPTETGIMYMVLQEKPQLLVKHPVHDCRSFFQEFVKILNFIRTSIQLRVYFDLK